MRLCTTFEGQWLAARAGFRLAEDWIKLLEKGCVSDAESVYQRAQAVFRLDPAHYLFVAQLGLAVEAKGNLENAVGYLARAVALKPGNAMGHVGLGDRYAKLEQLGAAVASYRAALNIDASQSQPRYNMAVMMKRMGQMEGALRQRRQVVKDTPDHALAHANIAAMMMQEKNFLSSIHHLELVLKAKPDFHPVRFQLGLLLEQAGKRDQAKAHYEQLLKADPSFAPALKRLAKMSKN